MCGIEIDLVFASGSNLTSCAGDKIDFGFVRGPKINWFSFIDRNWLNFKRGDRNWLGLCVRAENDLCLVRKSDYLVFARVVEIDLVFVCWTRVTWFYWDWTWLRSCVGGRKWLDLIVGDRTWFDSNVGIGIDLVLVWGSKMTWLQYLNWNYLGFSMGIEIDLFLCKDRKRSVFFCLHRNWLGLCWESKLTSFQCRDQNELGLGVGVEVDLGLV